MAAQLNRHVIINFFKKFLYITKNYAIRCRIRKDKMAGIYKGKMGCSENIWRPQTRSDTSGIQVHVPKLQMMAIQCQ